MIFAVFLSISFMVVSFALLFVACSKPESEAVFEPPLDDAAAPAEERLPRPDVGQAVGSDPTVVDPDHYTVEFENEAVGILRIEFGAGEESVMHYHPDSVAVFVTDHLVQMTMPDGSTEELSAAVGDAMFVPGGQHLPENISDSARELGADRAETVSLERLRDYRQYPGRV